MSWTLVTIDVQPRYSNRILKAKNKIQAYKREHKLTNTAAAGPSSGPLLLLAAF